MPQLANDIQTIALVSLGCPKNLVDSERMLGLLAEDGLVVTPHPADADVIIINTCGFLQAAKIESLKEIHEAIELKRTGRCKRVVVAGCLVQRYKTKLLAEAPGIDRLLGVFDRQHIVQAVRGRPNPRAAHGHFLGRYHDLSRRSAAPAFETDQGRLRLTPRHYAYLRISDGCNQGCSFCTIPWIRGPMRSKPPQQILAEAQELACDGAVELNLIGQETTSYGTDIGYTPGLGGLLKTLDKQLSDVLWLRVMYAYPLGFTDQIIKTLADCPRVVKYIDLPLQHINDEILKKMKRRVTRKQIEALLDKLRKCIPGIAIRTTFIAGSPGETDAQHQELLQFIREFGFDMLGVFPYSREPGTPMARMEGQLPDPVKNARVKELMLNQQQIAFAKALGMKGKTIQVLIDAKPEGKRPTWIARHPGQAPEIDSTTLLRAPHLHLGQMLEVKVTGSKGYDLLATLPRNRTHILTVLPQ